MLKLPPTDPRNWYRNAFIHELDCPHGNWWFLPWHRGYLGWFERTCRELSGDPDFALPYWDWTANPTLPAVFAEDSVLNPANLAFIASSQDFKDQMAKPVTDFYAGLSADQLSQLKIRGLADAATFSAQIDGDFFPGTQSRHPNFDATLRAAVSIDVIDTIIATTGFENFGSAKATAHSDSVGDNLLESQPHNHVHVAVGGLMGQFLSPVDPIFFMHHSNIDRIWDVWTRKQVAAGLDPLPEGADLDAWKKEPFLFYIDAYGKPVSENTAGAYAAIGDFDYSYQPGSGETAVAARVQLAEKGAEKRFAGTLSREHIDFQNPTVAEVAVPQERLRAAVGADGTELVARITLQLPADSVGMRYDVVVNPPDDVSILPFTEPNVAGTIVPFGKHVGGHVAKSVFFDVPLRSTIKKLHAAARLKMDKPLKLRVVPRAQGVMLKPITTPVKEIAVVAI